MSIAGFPTSSDIYLEVDGSQGGSGAELFRQGQQDQHGGGGLWREPSRWPPSPGQTSHVLELTRLYATDEAIRDGIDFYGLSGFSLVICKPDRKIIYSDCQWSSISESGHPGRHGGGEGDHRGLPAH